MFQTGETLIHQAANQSTPGVRERGAFAFMEGAHYLASERSSQDGTAAVHHAAGGVIARCQTFDDPAPIEAEWRAFEAGAVGPWNQCYDYVSRWCRYAAKAHGEKPFIVVAYDAQDQIAFIWPLAIVSRFGLPVLGWLGQSHGGYFFGMYRREIPARLTPQVIRGLLDTIRSRCPAAFALELKYLPLSFDGFENPLVRLAETQPGEPCFGVDIQGTFEEFTRSRFGSKKRSNLRKKREEFVQSGGRFDFPADRAQQVAIFDVFLRQKGEQLARAGAKNPFANPAIVDFYRSFVAGDQRDGSVEMSAVVLESRIAATCSSVWFKRRYYLIQLSMDAAASGRLSPGLLMMEEQVKRCFEAGVKTIDLGPGVGDHKAFWKCEPIERVTVRCALQPAGAPLVYLLKQVHRAKMRWKNHWTIQQARLLATRLKESLPGKASSKVREDRS